MHPSKLFNEVECMVNPGIYDIGLKQKLANVHPMNFIKTKVTLPLFRVSIEYDTVHGNHRNSEKYMIMNEPIDEDGEQFTNADIQAESILLDYNATHTKDPMDNLEIKNIDYICDLVLPIG